MNAPVQNQEVAMFIEVTNACLNLHSLPRSGGILDQDSYMMWGINLVLDAMNERREIEMRRQKAMAKH